jgi:hypothetical protein
MHGESKQDDGPSDPRVERLVLLQVAGKRWGERRERLYRTLRHIEPAALDAAIDSLQAAGVVIVKGRSVPQTRALKRIDDLRVICV